MAYRVLIVLILIIAAGWMGFYLARFVPDDGTRTPNVGVPAIVTDEYWSDTGGRPASIDDVLALKPGFEQTLMAHLVVSELNEDQIRVALAEVLSASPRLVADGLAAMLLQRYVGLNPSGALDYLETLAANERQLLTLTLVVYRELALADQTLALEAIERMDDPNRQQFVIRYLVAEKIIEEDLVSSLTQSRRRDAEKRREEMLERRQADAREALQRALDIPDARKRTTSATRAVERLASLSPETAFQSVSAIDDIELRPWLYESVLKSWSRQDYESAMAAARSLGANSNRYLRAALVPLAVTDPARAMEIAERMDQEFPVPTTPRYPPLTVAVLRRWAELKPLDAAAYLESKSYIDIPQMAQFVISALAREDPKAALAWVTRNDMEGNAASFPVARSYVSSFPQEAEEYVDGLESGPLRKAMLISLASSKGQRDPAGAVKWLAKYADDETYPVLVINVINRWVERDLPSATEFVLNIADDRQRDQNLMQIMQMTASRDPLATVAMLDHFGSPARKDQAISIIAGTIAWKDWDQGMALIDRISTSEKRRTARIRTIFQRFSQEPEKLDQTLDEYGFADDPEVASMMERLHPPSIIRRAEIPLERR